MRIGLSWVLGLWIGLLASSKGDELFSVVSVTLDDEALNRAHDVELSADGKLAFVPGKGGSTAILDVSDPEEPEILWYLRDEEVTPDSETVLPMGDRLLLGTKHFHVLDISEPEETRILKTISDEERIDRINGMVYVNGVVYAANKDGWVNAFDVSEVDAPTRYGDFETKKAFGLLSPHDIGWYREFVVVVDPRFFVGPDGAVGVIRIADYDTALPVEQWKLEGMVEDARLIGANRIQVVGKYAFVCGSWKPEARKEGELPQFAVVKLEDPGTPTVVASLPFRSERGPNGLTVAGHVVFCAGGQRVEAYDVSDPEKPEHLGGQDFPIYQVDPNRTDNYHDLIYRDGLLYVSAQCDNGFIVMRVEDERVRRLADGE